MDAVSIKTWVDDVAAPLIGAFGGLFATLGPWVVSGVQFAAGRIKSASSRAKEIDQAWKAALRAQHDFVLIDDVLRKHAATLAPDVVEDVRKAWDVAAKRVDEEAEKLDALEELDYEERARRLKGMSIEKGRLGQKLLEHAQSRTGRTRSWFALTLDRLAG